MISFKNKGDFSDLTNFLNNAIHGTQYPNLDKYGAQGVAALMAATPKDTGKTAASWYYKIERSKGSSTIGFYNRNINDGVPIAIILQYGHATSNGGWVEGRDYINPAIQPIFDAIAYEAWKEVSDYE